MADIRAVHTYTVDVCDPLAWTRNPERIVQQDALSQEFLITVKAEGTLQDLDGYSVQAYCIRADNSTVVVTGAITSGKVQVILPASAFTVVGEMQMAVRITKGDIRLTVLVLTTTVIRSTTDSIVDPGHVIPSLEELLAKISACEAAASAATAATGTANTAAGSANTAASNANTAATNATAAKDTALAAAAKLENMTVHGETGTQSSATVSEQDGHYHIEFTMEKGDQGVKGDRGNRLWYGTGITGTSTTPAVYSQSGVQLAMAGDMYVYNGTATAEVGNVYECTQGGDQATAKWRWTANWRGATGAGSVNFVNSHAPDADGNVDLSSDFDEKLDKTSVYNGLDSTSVTDALSAAMGKSLIDKMTPAEIQITTPPTTIINEWNVKVFNYGGLYEFPTVIPGLIIVQGEFHNARAIDGDSQIARGFPFPGIILTTLDSISFTAVNKAGKVAKLKVDFNGQLVNDSTQAMESGYWCVSVAYVGIPLQ